ncbi:MAG: ABC transporter substrate-binding protein [Propionibacteriaceae bacterium]|jgi:oligopeptide transport system substrate-binding protein|nr:ABC transporter substrate-binding protein [Propionibacteriaceae bacterium]
MKSTTRKVLGALVAAATALSLAACGTTSDTPTTGQSTADTATGAATAPTAITVRGCTPQNPLIPTNTNEVCGGNVLDASGAKLIHYNADNAAPELDIAESIESPDAINWTVKLLKGFKFQDGTEVKAKNFVDAWNWGAYGPNGQQNSYFFEMIVGFDDVQCTDAECAAAPKAETMSGLAIVDDYTFTIETISPTSNLKVRLGYTAFEPQPDAFFGNQDNWGKTGGILPIAAGPYKIVANTDTEIVLEKFADYSGKFPGSVDKVTFKVYNDTSTAYQDVVSNNLDLTDVIPTEFLVGDVYKADLSNRWGVKDTGVFQALTFAPATTDPGLADIRVRQAISMAVDRSEITDVVFNNARIPATGWVSPVVDGYKADQCTNCVFDPAKAKDLLAEAGGYPGTLELWVNGDGGHDTWANAVCNQIKNNLGLDCVVQATPDFKTLRDKINKRELKGLYRAGWQMDYPSIENFLAPIYLTGASSNDSDYSNAQFDTLLHQAAEATDEATANKLYQQAEALLNTDMPTMPLWYQQSQFGWSNKIKSVKMTPFSTFDFGSVVLN